MADKPEEDGIDEEIKNLIDGLDDFEPPEQAENLEAFELPEEPMPLEAPDPVIPTLMPKLSPPGPSIPKIVTPAIHPAIEPVAQSTTNLDKLTSKFHIVFDELLVNMRADREQMDGYINVYALNAQSEAPKQSFVEGLVGLVTAKAKVSSDAVKLLDTAAKMLAASKSIALGDKGIAAPQGEMDRLMNDSDYDPAAP